MLSVISIGSAVSDRGVENIMRVLCNNTTLKSLAIECKNYSIQISNVIFLR